MTNIQNNVFKKIRKDFSDYYEKIQNKPMNIVPKFLNYDIIVFSHLRWSFVTQRPQHILSRFAKGNHRVLFIEESIEFTEENKGTVKEFEINENITVLQPRISRENLVGELLPILEQYSKEMELKNPVLWFYSPEFSGVLNYFENQSLVVYDCMDELSLFKGAPTDMQIKEMFLIHKADVIFTGGKSLYDSKKQHAESVYCFPSSVDEKHFKKAFLPKTKTPEEFKNIPGPISGFYGVLDERLDLELIEKTAGLLPKISFVFIGPVVKISEADLPKGSNIYYLGEKHYNELPAYLKAVDVAIMPFALNDATKFISPTKTLEFMAAGKPIVSTAIRDVVRDYSDVVRIAQSPLHFALEIKNSINEKTEKAKERELKQKEILGKTSWDYTVKAMKTIINNKLREGKNSGLKGAFNDSKGALVPSEGF